MIQCALLESAGGALAEAADSWHLALLEKGFSAIEL
jgi:hypothetical protein